MTIASIAMTAFKGLAAATALLLVGTAVGLWWYQTSLIYPSNIPAGSRTTVSTPDEHDIPYEDLTLTTPDGVKVKAYFMIARSPTEMRGLQGKAKNKESVGVTEYGKKYAKGRPTLLYFHANAGNLGHRLPIAKVFWARFGMNVVMLSYRGYGNSEGKASEKGLRIDAQTALDWVTNHPILGGTKVVVYGQSIGGCVCIDVASRNPSSIKAMIIENAPLSLPTLIPLLMPFLSPFLPILLTEKWDAHLSIPKLDKKIKVLGLVGLKDELVREGQMIGIKKLLEKEDKVAEKLAGGTAGEKKVVKRKLVWKDFPNGTHNDTFAQPGYFTHVFRFITEEILEEEWTGTGMQRTDDLIFTMQKPE